jgi:hypothetical protein
LVPNSDIKTIIKLLGSLIEAKRNTLYAKEIFSVISSKPVDQ